MLTDRLLSQVMQVRKDRGLELAKFIKQAQIPETEQLEVALDCLESDAAYWAEIYRFQWHTFQNFKEGILNNFWSTIEQNKVRMSIIKSIWDSRKTISLVARFAKFVSQYKIKHSNEREIICVRTHGILSVGFAISVAWACR